jgi:urease accessory protein
LNPAAGHPKPEIRNPGETRNSKPETSVRSGDSDFGFRVSDLTLWQLSDSAFPTGGFAHSAGLEAAWQHGEVKNRGELISFIETSLLQLGSAALPFVIAAHNEPGRLREFDQLYEAFTTNHVANRASRAQGKAFLAAVQRIFLSGKGSQSPRLSDTPFNHFPCVFGGALSLLDIPAEIATRLFFFNHLRGIVAAAVRLNIVGPMEAQTLQQQLSSTTEKVMKACGSLTLDDIAQTSPLLDIWQGGQDRLYSRLFQS